MQIKNKCSEEPRLGSVIAWLLNDDGVEDIKVDTNKLLSTLYFLNEDQLSSFHHAIKQLNENEYGIVLKNLMQLYPLSTPIVMEILKESSQQADKVLKLYDLGDELAFAWNKLLNLIKQQTTRIPAIVKTIEERIEQYELEKAKWKEDLIKLEKAESKYKGLHNEVEKLKQEYKELEKSYTKEELERQKIEIEDKLNEKRKIKEQYEKNKQQIMEIEKNLKKVESENAAYKESLKALSKVVKTLSDREVD